MPVKVGDIIEPAFKTDHFRRQLVLDQKAAGMTYPDLSQKIRVCFFGHQPKISAKRCNA
jgi:hypothetical protein